MVLAAAPGLAQETQEPAEPFSRGFEEMLRDLVSDLEPKLRELRDAIGNLDDYEAPEMLPNGDILIRRKTPLEPSPDPGNPEIELAPDESIEH